MEGELGGGVGIEEEKSIEGHEITSLAELQLIGDPTKLRSADLRSRLVSRLVAELRARPEVVVKNGQVR